MLIATEELSAASLACGGSLMTRPEILVRALLSGGSEEQRRSYLPRIASGAAILSFAFVERSGEWRPEGVGFARLTVIDGEGRSAHSTVRLSPD